jgi:hypothetical protein
LSRFSDNDGILIKNKINKMGFFDFLKKRKAEKKQQAVQTGGLTDVRKKEISKKLTLGGAEELKQLKTRYPKEDERPKIKISNLSDALEKIQDKNMIEVIQNYKDKSTVDRKVSNKTFDTRRELIGFLKEVMITPLVNRYEDLKDRISDIRKAGKKAGNLNYKIMQIPLKIKVFNTNFKQKELDMVNNLMNSIEEKIKGFELAIKKEEEQKELLEKKKLEKEKLAKQKEAQKVQKPVVKKQTTKPVVKPQKPVVGKKVVKGPVKIQKPVVSKMAVKSTTK